MSYKFISLPQKLQPVPEYKTAYYLFITIIFLTLSIYFPEGVLKLRYTKLGTDHQSVQSGGYLSPNKTVLKIGTENLSLSLSEVEEIILPGITKVYHYNYYNS